MNTIDPVTSAAIKSAARMRVSSQGPATFTRQVRSSASGAKSRNDWPAVTPTLLTIVDNDRCVAKLAEHVAGDRRSLQAHVTEYQVCPGSLQVLFEQRAVVVYRDDRHAVIQELTHNGEPDSTRRTRHHCRWLSRLRWGGH